MRNNNRHITLINCNESVCLCVYLDVIVCVCIQMCVCARTCICMQERKEIQTDILVGVGFNSLQQTEGF